MADSYACSGAAPDWVLTLNDDQARFGYLDRESVLDIPQTSIAQGADWPRAYTLIGPRDSAIVVLTDQICGTSPFSAHVLTQRGQTPVMLTGCCVRTTGAN